MIKEAIDRILALAPPVTEKIKDRIYSNQTLHPLDPPKVYAIELNTLAGIVTYFKNFDATERSTAAGILINSPTMVSLVGTLDKPSGKRNTYAVARYGHGLDSSDFGQHEKRDVEDFSIFLQTRFLETTAKSALLKMIGNMKAEKIKVAEDDGITQTVSQRVGASMSSKAPINNPFALMPFRTFTEINQPSSPFIFRVHQRSDELPNCSLSECDGGAWEIEAIRLIAEYFSKELPDIPVMA